jgi:hypothetical protein
MAKSAFLFLVLGLVLAAPAPLVGLPLLALGFALCGWMVLSPPAN